MGSDEFSMRVLQCEQKLFRIAYLSLAHDADVEDCVQEALLNAWRHIGSLREPEHFETWLIRILINECKGCGRKRARQRTVALGEYDPPMPEPEDPNLRDLVRALPDKYRLPIALHHLEGYPMTEVARMMKLTRSMVRWRLDKGMRMLRQTLREEEWR
jgi:RNA polymerase sigma-70 factor (ECF subfamily)